MVVAADAEHLAYTPQDSLEAELDHAAQSYRRSHNGLVPLTCGWNAIPVEQASVIVDRAEIPVFERPTFQSETVAVAVRGERLPLLRRWTRHAYLRPPLSKPDFEVGLWVEVLLRDQRKGWFFAGSMDAPHLATIVPAIPKSEGLGLWWVVIVLAGAFVFFLLCVFVKWPWEENRSYTFESSGGGDDTDASTPDESSADEEDESDPEAERESPIAIRISVRIVDRSGDPLENARVRITYPSVLGLDCFQPEDKKRTDSDGWVHFESPQRRLVRDGRLQVSFYVNGVLVADEVESKQVDTFSYTVER